MSENIENLKSVPTGRGGGGEETRSGTPRTSRYLESSLPRVPILLPRVVVFVCAKFQRDLSTFTSSKLRTNKDNDSR